MKEAIEIIESFGAIPADAGARANVSFKLNEALRNTQPFNKLAGTMLRFPDGSATSADSLVGHRILELLISGQSPSQIVEQATADIAGNTCETYEVRAIRGLKVSREYKIADGIKLVPNSELPPSQYNDWAFSHPDKFFDMRDDAAALVIEASVSPALVPNNGSPFSEDTLPGIKERAEFTNSLCFALILAGDGLVLPTFQYGIEKRASLLSGYRGITYTLGTPYIPSNSEIDMDRALELLGLLQNFSERSSIELAIGRLASARGKASPVDRAIDMGMALEIATMHGDKNSNQEIRHKIGLRIGWLFGNDPEARRRLSEGAKKVYDARSSAVHGGDIRVKNFSIPEADSLVRDSLISILRRGRFPDWTDLSFGGAG